MPKRPVIQHRSGTFWAVIKDILEQRTPPFRRAIAQSCADSNPTSKPSHPPFVHHNPNLASNPPPLIELSADIKHWYLFRSCTCSRRASVQTARTGDLGSRSSTRRAPESSSSSGTNCFQCRPGACGCAATSRPKVSDKPGRPEYRK